MNVRRVYARGGLVPATKDATKRGTLFMEACAHAIMTR